MPVSGVETPVANASVDPDQADPFPYGWRYVPRERPDGYVDLEQVPLTLEDLLHPEEGDQVTQSDAHQRRCRYLCDVFESRLSHIPSAAVLHDVRIKWDLPELRPHGPDIMVILGVQQRKNWSTFDVAEEGVRPALIVEVTSPETSAIDRDNKLEQYDIAGVPLYVIVDTVRRRGESIVRLLGYQQIGPAYTALAPDERGWLWLEPVGVWLGVASNEVYCYTKDGTQIGDYATVTAALTAEMSARVQAEQHAAQESAARVQAEQHAAQEATARAQAEERVRVLEAELRHLRGQK